MTLLLFFLAGLLSYALGRPAARILRHYSVIDRPNARSSHFVPTVRGGGVAIIATIAGGLVLGMATGGIGFGEAGILLGGVLLLAIVSFIDDLRSIGPAIRFGCHGLVAITLIRFLGVPDFGSDAWGVRLCGAVVGFLWIAGYTNAFNFMDGINGLASGQATLSGLGTAALAWVAGLPLTHPVVWVSLLIAGATAGFLPHNFPRARMFMGDVGSAPLGCLLATMGWWLASSVGGWWLLAVGLLHANFVLDTAFTLLRRMTRGEKWYEAHREHFYQRLIRSGKTHSFVTGWEMAGQAGVLGLLLLAAHAGSLLVWVLTGAAVLALWSGFFVYAEKLFNAATRELAAAEKAPG